MEKWTTQYDESQFMWDEIDFFKENKREFIESILWDENREEESITDKEIEDHFFNDEYLYETHKEQFLYDLNEEFMDYVDCEVYVEGKNMGWRNRSGYKEFTLKRGEDIFYQIAPQCELTYHIEKVKEKEYEVKIFHHDSPMGENYTIKIK